MITILTVTKRNGWFEETLKSVQGQTVSDVRWIIVHEPNVKPVPAPNVEWVLAPPKKRVSNLCASNNAGLRLIETEY